MHKRINLFKSAVGRMSLTFLKEKGKCKSIGVPGPKLLIKIIPLNHVNLFKSEVCHAYLAGLENLNIQIHK